MIPNNELRINNEVFYDDKTFCTVVGINWGSTVELAGCEGFISITDIEPIPLTPELLEQCGFEPIDDDGLWQHKEEQLFQLGDNYLQQDGFSFIWDAAFTGVVIEHFHHLQNVFHALTGQELEIQNL